MSQTLRDHPEHYVVVTIANSNQALPVDAASSPHGYMGAASYQVSSSARAAALRIANIHQLTAVAEWPIAALGVHCLVYQIAVNADREQVMQQLASDRLIESAQALETFTTQASGANTEPQLSDLHSDYNDPYANLQTNLTALAIPQAQRISNGADVTIAVIDTGVDSAHPDLAKRLLPERNFVDADIVQFHRDHHGTAVTGVIAAVPNNKLGIVGIAPAAHILPLKACWQTGDTARCNSFTLAQALAAAIDARADIVNLSLAGPADSLLTRLVHIGQARGMIFVGAVPEQQSAPIFPADVDDVIAVEASSAVAATHGHVAAPDKDVLTLTPDGHYDAASGSSMAAAQVTGIIALMRSLNNKLTAVQARDALVNSTHQRLMRNATLSSVDACEALAIVTKTTCNQSRALTQR